MFLCLVLGIVFVWSAAGQRLAFKYTAGDKYHIKTTVQEEVYLNGSLHHRAQILNKISVEVTEVRDGAGHLSALFQTSERRTDRGAYELTQDYRSEFWRDARGKFTIAARYFMPVVRDVPLFPDKPVTPGDTWVAEGSEAHDFRKSGIPEPLSFPITVNYRYVGVSERDSRRVADIRIEYTVFHRMEARRGLSSFDPVRITGQSRQIYHFDIDLGKPLSYEEKFDFIFILAGGDEVEYRGTSQGKLLTVPALDRSRMAQEIRKRIDAEQIPDASVTVDDQGVTITLERIHFPPDSAELLPSEQEKLRRIGRIIAGYDRDVLITGHTARVGSEESCQRLSEERARAVGDFLLSVGAKRADQMVFKGMGSRAPVADNATEAGREQNRRVEITILEN